MNFVDSTTNLILFTPSLKLPKGLSRRDQLSTTLATPMKYEERLTKAWEAWANSNAHSQYEKRPDSMESRNGRDFVIE
jgi:hypothetical protein